MNRTELNAFTETNTATSFTNIQTIDGITYKALDKKYGEFYFKNDQRITSKMYDNRPSSDSPVTTIVNYNLPDNHVRLTYYGGTLEQIRHEHLNSDQVNVIDKTTNFELKETK